MSLPLTTTLAAYTAHNTSANAAYNQTNFPPNFGSVTWVDTGGTTLTVDPTKSDASLNPITPAHVSPVSIKTLIPNFHGPWYAHLNPWWGSTSHMDNGTNSQSSLWANALSLDLIARGFDGIIIDWYGSGSYEDTSLLSYIKPAIATHGLTYIIMIDAQSYTTTAQLQTHLTYINSTYFSDPRYGTHSNHPIVMFFNTVAGVNYTTAKATGGLPTMYWIMQGSGQLANAYADAAFDWNHPYSSGVPGGDPYNATTANFFLSAVHSSAKGSMPCLTPGFNGYDTSVKEGSYKKGWYMPRDNGKCWLSQASVINANVPINCIGIQVATWQDYEEGTEIETAIDNGITVTASISGHTLSWSVSGGTGDESTINNYSLLASPDGVNAAFLGSIAAGGVHSIDLTTISGWGTTTYTIYVVAVGQPSIKTQFASAGTYTASTSTGRNTLSGGNFVNPSGQPLSNGYLKMRLTRDCAIPEIGQIGRESVVKIQLDSTGNVLGTPAIWPNDQLSPSGSQYIVRVYTSSGLLASGPYLLTVTSTPSPFILP